MSHRQWRRSGVAAIAALLAALTGCSGSSPASHGTPVSFSVILRSNSPLTLLVPVQEPTRKYRPLCWTSYRAVATPDGSQIKVTLFDTTPATGAESACDTAKHPFYVPVPLTHLYAGHTLIDTTTGRLVTIGRRVSALPAYLVRAR